MKKIKKLAPDLTVDDFKKYPIWEYTNADEDWADETVVTPVTSYPTIDFSGCVIGLEFTLNNGVRVWGTICNLDQRSVAQSQLFRNINIYKDKEVFHLARYFDAGTDRFGPAKLAEFLGLSISDVFPIHYDLTDIATGNYSTLVGDYPAEPKKRLTKSEIMKAIFAKD